MSEKAKEILSDVLGYILIIITCVLYVLTTIFVISPTGKTIWQILVDGILVLAMGITIDHLFRYQGIINGMNTKLVSSTMVLYGQTLEKINVKINKLNDWCVVKNKRTYKEQRTKILSRAGLKYEDYFDENGISKPFLINYEEEPILISENKLTRSEKKSLKIRNNALKRKNKEAKKEYCFKKACYWNAVNLKLTELYQSDLTSEAGKKDDPNNLGPKISEYMMVDSAKTWIIRIFFAIIMGIYGITLIKDFSLIELLWRSFQICLFTAFGFIKMRQTTMFITNDYRGRIIKKINNLDEFFADVTTNFVESKEVLLSNDDGGEKNA